MEKSSWTKQFDMYAQSLLKEFQVPGAAIGLYQNGSVLYENCFGFRNLQQKWEVNPDTNFGIASITKSFTAMAILKLQEEGKLSIEDPIIRYIPEFRTPESKYQDQITIHHLLSHSSGIPPLPSIDLCTKRSLMEEILQMDTITAILNQEPIDTYEELVNYVSQLDYEFLGKPGTSFSYSNDGFSLLGFIIERVAGKSYEDYLQEVLFQPAGMKHTFLCTPGSIDRANITTIYAAKEIEGVKEIYASPFWSMAPAMASSGFLNSTLHDLQIYLELYRTTGMIGEQRILNPESIKQMTTPYMTCDYQKSYGYGLQVIPNYFGKTLISHGGSSKGVSSFVLAVPETGVTGVMLTNLSGVPVSKILLALLHSFEGRKLEQEHFPTTQPELSDEQLHTFTGDYQSMEQETRFTIHLEQSKLTFSYAGGESPMIPIDTEHFRIHVKGREFIIGFISNENGIVTRATFGMRQIQKVT